MSSSLGYWLITKFNYQWGNQSSLCSTKTYVEKRSQCSYWAVMREERLATVPSLLKPQEGVSRKEKSPRDDKKQPMWFLTFFPTSFPSAVLDLPQPPSVSHQPSLCSCSAENSVQWENLLLLACEGWEGPQKVRAEMISIGQFTVWGIFVFSVVVSSLCLCKMLCRGLLRAVSCSVVRTFSWLFSANTNCRAWPKQ